jgi:hypothetical protein
LLLLLLQQPSFNSVARSSVDDTAAAGTVGAAGAGVASTSAPRGDEKNVEQEEEHLYEVDVPQQPRRRSWLRRHWLVITIATITTMLLAVLIGVVIIKTGILHRGQNNLGQERL